MNLRGDEMRKHEYMLDIFKGTCELYNYEPGYFKAFGGSVSDDIEKIIQKEDWGNRNVYFYGPVLDEEECAVFGGCRNNDNPYALSEVVTLGVKILENVGLDDVRVQVDKKETGELISNLEALDIEVETEEEVGGRFVIFQEDKPLIMGSTKDDKIYFYGNVSEVVNTQKILTEKMTIDAYISPMDEDTLDDAFVIGSNLRQAGFKIVIDYSMKQVTKDDVDAIFLVTFTKEDIAKYQVKLVDMDTKEIKTVMIDNLIEELSFM